MFGGLQGGFFNRGSSSKPAKSAPAPQTQSAALPTTSGSQKSAPAPQSQSAVLPTTPGSQSTELGRCWLLNLPVEVLDHMESFLNASDLCNVCCASKVLSDSAQELWHQLVCWFCFCLFTRLCSLLQSGRCFTTRTCSLRYGADAGQLLTLPTATENEITSSVGGFQIKHCWRQLR